MMYSRDNGRDVIYDDCATRDVAVYSRPTTFDVTKHRGDTTRDVTLYGSHGPPSLYDSSEENVGRWLPSKEPVYGHHRKRVTFKGDGCHESRGDTRRGERREGDPTSGSDVTTSNSDSESEGSAASSSTEGGRCGSPTATRHVSLGEDILLTMNVHGFRRLHAAKGSRIKRLLWILLLILVLSVCCFNVYTQVQLYLSHPTLLHTLPLLTAAPHTETAVTICNLNKHKVTELVGRGWLTPLDSLYTDSLPDSSSSSPSSEDTFNVSSRDVIMTSAHHINNMLLSCHTDHHKCGLTNFSLTLTQNGVCYTIVPMAGKTETLDVLLNLECFEEHAPSSRGRGVSVSVHQKGALPIHQEALLPVGVKAVVRTDPDTIHLATANQETCEDNVISAGQCESKCAGRAVQEACGCRAFWMPDGRRAYRIIHHGHGKYCSMYQQVKCVETFMDTFSYTTCRCRPVCSHLTSTKLVSTFSSLPTINIESLVDESSMTSTMTRYHVTTALRDLKSISRYQHMTSLISAFSSTLDDVTEELSDLRTRLLDAMEKSEEYLREMRMRVSAHVKLGLMGVKKMVENGFIDGWRVVEQRLMNRLLGEFTDTMVQFDRTVNRLLYTSASESTVRKVVYFTLYNQLASNMDLAIQAVDNFTKVYYAFLNGDPLSNHLVTPGRRYDDVLIPLDLLVDNTEAHKEFYNGLTQILAGYIQKIIVLQDMLKDVYQRSYLNNTAHNEAQTFFSYNSQRLSFYLNMFRDKIVAKVPEAVEHELLNFKKANHSMHTAHALCQRSLMQVADLLGPESKLIQMRIVAFRQLAQDYLTADDPNKMADLVKSGLSDELQMALLYLQQVTWQLSSNSVLLNESWSREDSAIQRVWLQMLGDRTLRNFYIRLNNDVTDMVRNPMKTTYFTGIFLHAKMLDLTQADMAAIPPRTYFTLLNSDAAMFTPRSKADDVHDMITVLQDETYITPELISSARKLQVIFAEVTETLRDFRRRSQIDSSFSRENLLSLHVKLDIGNSSQVQTVDGYTLTELLRDVGIVFAIFLGISVLTLFEALELFLTRILCYHGDKKGTLRSPLHECKCGPQGGLLHKSRSEGSEDGGDEGEGRPSNHVTSAKTTSVSI